MRHSLLALLLTAILPSVLLGQSSATTEKNGEGFARLSGGAARTSNFYNTEGDLRLFDSLYTSFSAATFGVSLDYGITDALELNLDLPIGYYNVTSAERFPSRTIFAPAYYGVGATYGLSRDSLAASISAMVKIPRGFHQGIYDDPDHPTFLSDGFLQATGAFNVGFKRDELWVSGTVGYNWRDEEPADEILYAGEVGISKVEGTGIFVGFGGVISTADVSQPLRPFYAGASGSAAEVARRDGGTGTFRTIDRETYFALSPGFFVTLFDRFMIDGKYTIRLFGQNSLALQGAYLGIGYRFGRASF